MVNNITVRHLRTSALVVSALGVVFAVAFALGPFRLVFFEELLWDLPPYVLVALAAGISRNRGVSLVVLLAGISVLALGTYTYADLMRSLGSINDIQLVTAPWQWLVSLLALVAASVGFIVTRIKDA